MRTSARSFITIDAGASPETRRGSSTAAVDIDDIARCVLDRVFRHQGPLTLTWLISYR
jgi:hypothetical protein